MANTAQKAICSLCAPKETVAIMSCKGFLKDFCRKHFNEHRDVLSKDLQNVFDLHDSLLQELQLKIDSAREEPVDPIACTLLKQIDGWENTTIESVVQAANEIREEIKRLSAKKLEFDPFNQRISKLTTEIKEQQDSESFVETDINQWIKQLEQLKSDLNRPSEFHSNAPDLQIKKIDWDDMIKISFGTKTPSAVSPLMEKWLATADMLLKLEKEEKKELMELANEMEMKSTQKEKELKQMQIALTKLEKRLPWWKK